MIARTPPEERSDVVAQAHDALTFAAQRLQSLGLDERYSALLMLGFSAAWLRNAEGAPAAAEDLYRSADAMTGKGHGIVQ